MEIEYCIDPSQRAAFVRQARAVGKMRRRDGARLWRLYRDLADHKRYRERFIVDSWAEYLRSRSRGTMADREDEEQLRTFHVGKEPIRATHMITEL